MIIDIEDEKTWPDEVRRLLKNNLRILEHISRAVNNYEVLPYQERIKAHQPSQSDFFYIVDEIDSLIAGCMVVGYHCTRLLDDEIEEIRASGFSLPSVDLLKRRLQKLLNKNLITEDEYSQILNENEYNTMKNRENRLYFVCGTSPLKNEWGISKFFRCWGGEAIFNTHEITNLY